MISINKQGNAIVIEFTDNDKYLFNGKIEVAPNELIVVVDQSDMVTFKRASNGDVLFSQLVDDIQIAGSPVTKDTIIDQFALIGFTSGGGGGAGGAVSSVNGQTGDVIITPASLNVCTRAEVDADINAETTERQKQDSALGGMIAAETAARERAVASKQDTLVSGQNIKTINGETLLGEGNIEIQGGTSNWDDITGKPEFAEVATSGDYNDLTNKPTIPDVSNLATKEEIADMETKAHAAATYATKAEIPSLEGYLTETEASETYATKQEVSSKQDQLVSGTNIKTVNGQSLLGNGNIDITSGGTITVDSALSTTSENPVQNKVITNAINGKQDAGDYALKSEIPDVSTLATKEELADKQDALTAGAGIKIADNTIRTINNVQQAKIIPQASGFIFNTISVDNAGNPSVVNAQLSNTKDQDIQFEPNSSNPSTPTIYIKLSDNIVRKTVADQTYATKQELGNKLDTATYNSEKEGFETKENAAATYQVKGDYATTSQLNSKQDTLVSGTNIKTINGNSILGAGDITIGGSSVEVDDTLSTTSENPVQNKVITKRLNSIDGESVKLGFSSAASTLSNAGAVAIGRTADAGSQNNSKYGIAIGAGATTTGNSAIAIGGYGTMAQATYATVIGGQSNSNVEHSIVIGDNISNTTDKVVIGSGEKKYISVGQDDKVNIRKSDGSTIAIEDSIPTFWTGTQTEYDSIQDKDENTYYFIKEG